MNEDSDDPAPPPPRPTIKVVGPCKSGKSTLVAGLQALGYAARSCSQEHSDVPTMWQRISPADLLIFLDLSLPTQRRRAGTAEWDGQWLAVQQSRLAHARAHADLVLHTDQLSPAEVLARTAAFLQASGQNQPSI